MKHILLLLVMSVLTGCAERPVKSGAIVASTGWTAAFAELAGATNVIQLAPPGMQHPSEYELRPGDVVRIKNADLILFAGYETMVSKIVSEINSDSTKLLQIPTDYSEMTIRNSVIKIADRLGTHQIAEANLNRLTSLYDSGRAVVLSKQLIEKRVVVSHFVVPIVKSLGFKNIEVFSPGRLEPAQLMRLKEFNPELIVDNIHNHGGQVLADLIPDARYCLLMNFPGTLNTHTLEDVLRFNITALSNPNF